MAEGHEPERQATARKLPSAWPSSVRTAAILLAPPILVVHAARSIEHDDGGGVGRAAVEGAFSAAAGARSKQSGGQEHEPKPRAAFPPHGDRSDQSGRKLLYPFPVRNDRSEIPLGMRPIWGVFGGLCPSAHGAGFRHCSGPRFQDRERDLSPPRSEAMTNPTLDLLLARRSVSANSLAEPGPSAAELELMLAGRLARARPQEARALALSPVSGRGAGRIRQGPGRGLRAPRRRIPARSGSRTRRSASCARRSSSP